MTMRLATPVSGPTQLSHELALAWFNATCGGPTLPHAPELVDHLEEMWSSPEPLMMSQWRAVCQHLEVDVDERALQRALSILMNHPKATVERTPGIAAATRDALLPEEDMRWDTSRPRPEMRLSMANTNQRQVELTIFRWQLSTGRIPQTEASEGLAHVFRHCETAAAAQDWMDMLRVYLTRPDMERARHADRRRRRVLRGVFDEIAGQSYVGDSGNVALEMLDFLLNQAPAHGTTLDPPESNTPTPKPDYAFHAHWRALLTMLSIRPDHAQLHAVARATAQAFPHAMSTELQSLGSSLARFSTSIKIDRIKEINALDASGALLNPSLHSPQSGVSLSAWLLHSAQTASSSAPEWIRNIQDMEERAAERVRLAIETSIGISSGTTPATTRRM